MREIEVLNLQKPVNSTAAGVTGTYTAIAGYINAGGREVKFVLDVGAGTTAGTAGGSVQSAADTAGTGLATVVTFTTLTSAGGQSVKYGVIPAAHSYVRFLGSVQTGKDMLLACNAHLTARVSP